MGVNERPPPAFATEQFVYRHTRLSPFDIPECLVNSANGVVQNRAIAPVRRVIHRLPEILDCIGGPSYQEWSEIPVHGLDNEIGALGESGTAIAVEPILVRQNLHYHKAYASRLGRDNRDFLNFWGRHATQ